MGSPSIPPARFPMFQIGTGFGQRFAFHKLIKERLVRPAGKAANGDKWGVLRSAANCDLPADFDALDLPRLGVDTKLGDATEKLEFDATLLKTLIEGCEH